MDEKQETKGDNEIREKRRRNVGCYSGIRGSEVAVTGRVRRNRNQYINTHE